MKSEKEIEILIKLINLGIKNPKTLSGCIDICNDSKNENKDNIQKIQDDIQSNKKKSTDFSTKRNQQALEILRQFINGISANDLMAKLGVTKMIMYNAIYELKQQGYIIESKKNGRTVIYLFRPESTQSGEKELSNLSQHKNAKEMVIQELKQHTISDPTSNTQLNEKLKIPLGTLYGLMVQLEQEITTIKHIIRGNKKLYYWDDKNTTSPNPISNNPKSPPPFQGYISKPVSEQILSTLSYTIPMSHATLSVKLNKKKISSQLCVLVKAGKIIQIGEGMGRNSAREYLLAPKPQNQQKEVKPEPKIEIKKDPEPPIKSIKQEVNPYKTPPLSASVVRPKSRSTTFEKEIAKDLISAGASGLSAKDIGEIYTMNPETVNSRMKIVMAINHNIVILKFSTDAEEMIYQNTFTRLNHVETQSNGGKSRDPLEKK
jgi:biotin operon repressor